MKKPVPTPVAPAVAARTPTGSARNVSRSGSDFLNLPGDRFVVELAHGASESDLAATRASLHPSDGDLYTVHLRQNGADIWLLVWGSFDSIDAARSARSEMAAQGTIMPGWPRKIAPLQAEVRRVLDQ
jgi:septal ring-binding cell division protein DamX